MQFLNAVAVCTIVVGVLMLAETFRAGHETIGSLIAGGGIVAFGVLLSAIANVGMKLNRIEDRLRRPSDDKSDSILD